MKKEKVIVLKSERGELGENRRRKRREQREKKTNGVKIV